MNSMTTADLQVSSDLKLTLKLKRDTSGADPGFPVGGGVNLPGGGAKIRFCQIFRKTA